MAKTGWRKQSHYTTFVNNPYTVQGKDSATRLKNVYRNALQFRTSYDPANIQNDMNVWLRGGSGPGGISRPAAADPGALTQSWFIGPNGMVLPYTAEAERQAELGQKPTAVELLAGYSSGDESGTIIDMPGFLTPDGQIVTADPDQAAAKFAEARDKAYSALIQQRMSDGRGTPQNAIEERALRQQAEQMALADMSIYVGGNPDNYPKSMAGPLDTPIYAAGQFFPTFPGGESGRSITEEEAETLNFIRNSGVVEDPDNMLAYLFDPTASRDDRARVLAEATGAMRDYSLSVKTASDALEWKWTLNPLEMGGQVLMGGLRLLGAAYDQYVIPSFTWTASALPGGPRTASWEEAQEIAPGQMLATVAGPRGSVMLNGPITNLGSQLGALGEWARTGDASNIRQLVEGQRNALFGDEAPWQNLGDGIYDADRREALFEDNYFGSQISGGLGFNVNVVWDPLWVAGPAGKAIRVSHRLGMGAGAIRSADDAAKNLSFLQRGTTNTRDYDLALRQVRAAERSGNADEKLLARDILESRKAAKDEYMKNDASPIERFVDWAMSEKRTPTEIRRHAVVENSTVTNEIAMALSRAKSYEEAFDVMRAGLGDQDALKRLYDLSSTNAEMLRRAEIQVQVDNMVSAPDKYMKAYDKVYREVEDAMSEVRRLEDELIPDPLKRLSNPDNEPMMDAWARMMQPDKAMRDRVRRRRAVYLREDVDAEARLEERLAQARLDGAPVDVIDDIVNELNAAQARSRENFFARADGVAEPEELRTAMRSLDDALTRLQMLDEAAIAPPRTADDMARAAADLEEYVRMDEVLRNSIESANGLLNIRQVNFGQGRLQGLANVREGVRQRKAARKAFQMDTHRGASPLKALGERGWIRESFKRGMDDPGVVVWKWAGGIREATADAITRPITYAGMESPAGMMVLARGATTENWREAQATLNNLKIYGDQATWGTLSDGTRVTGAERKANIMERLSNKLNDPNYDPVQAVLDFEKDIIYDMSRYYAKEAGKSVDEFADDIVDMYRFLDYKRNELIDQIKDKGFWIDENGTKHVNPFLESQLAQGMPLADFRRMERLVRNYAKSGRSIYRNNVTRAYTQAAQDARDQLRLGRKREYEASVAMDDLSARAEKFGDSRALAKAARDGDAEAKALVAELRKAQERSLKTEKNVKDLEKRLDVALRDEALAGDKELGTSMRLRETGIEWFDQFQTLWRAGVLLRLGYPVRNTIDGVARRIAFEASIVPVLQDAVEGSRNIVSNALAGRVSTSVPFVQKAANRRKDALSSKAQRELERTGTLPRAVVKWADKEADRISLYRRNVQERRDSLERVIQEMREGTDGLDPVAREALDAEITNLLAHRRKLDADIQRTSKALEPFEQGNETELVLAYRQSLDRPRRIGDEFVFGVSGEMYYGMLSDPRYGPIMASEVSARETQQASVGLSLDIARSTMRAAVIKSGGKVSPGAPNYFESLAVVLNQHVKNSLIGDLWLRGVSESDAARIIMRREGARFRGVGQNLGRHTYVDTASKGTRKQAKAANKAARKEREDVLRMENELKAAEAERDGLATRLGSKKNRDRHEELNVEIERLREQLGGRTAPGAFSRQRGDLAIDSPALSAYWMEVNGLDNFDDVADMVSLAYREFNRIAPNPELRSALARGQVSPDLLRSSLDPKVYTLAPVHGSEIAILGGSSRTLSFVEKVNPTISRLFDFVGAMPEDTLIRVPFASRRYSESIETGSRFLAAYFPDGNVPAWAVESMMKQARRRAIKDTKTYMYTQDRRTNFGRVMERYIPFVSAWQNSTIAYTKMFKMNPEVLPFFTAAYMAPDRAGLVDVNGNVRIPIPAALAPITDRMGYDDEFVYNRDSLFVLPAQIDPLITFRSGPIIQMGASELMRSGLVGPVVPAPLKGMLMAGGLDADQAQQLWDMTARVTFGTDPETGRPLPPSTAWFGVDKVLPPWAQKFGQAMLTGFGNSPQNNAIYASHYTRIAREEMLRYMQGERDTLPTMDEVRGMTNMMYMTRVLNNLVGITGGPLGAITPPGIDSNIYSMQEVYRLMQDVVGYENADEAFTDLFGDEALLLANYSSTKSAAGMPISKDAFAVAEQHQGLIGVLAPSMDPSALPILSFMLDDGSYTSDDYDETVRAMQLSRNIPGTNIPWRQTLPPQEQARRAAVDTGWMMYTQTMTAIYADMRARGLKSLNSADAEPLRRIRDNFLERMRTDPLYAQWHADYQDGATRKIGTALDFMRSVMADDKFMSERGSNDSDMWRTAQRWLDERQKFRASMLTVKGQSEEAARALRAEWEELSSEIAESNLRFNEFWVRYLDTDDLTMD